MMMIEFASGTNRWGSIRAYIIPDPAGRPVGYSNPEQTATVALTIQPT